MFPVLKILLLSQIVPFKLVKIDIYNCSKNVSTSHKQKNMFLIAIMQDNETSPCVRDKEFFQAGAIFSPTY